MDGITITNGDGFQIAEDENGNTGIRVQNRAFVEEPRWIHVDVAGTWDRRQQIDDLIDALTQLRDSRSADSEDKDEK